MLIVDDDERNRRLARDVLRAAGLQTLEAATAAEGLALARERLPDVILMDVRLPDLEGTEAARRLADDERTSAIPVVAFSSLALGHDEAWLRAAGFAGSIDKPIDVETFADDVRRRCRGR